MTEQQHQNMLAERAALTFIAREIVNAPGSPWYYHPVQSFKKWRAERKDRLTTKEFIEDVGWKGKRDA